MTRRLSLRGTVSAADNSYSVDNQIFIYEANDLTRGWEIEAAYMWPTTTRASIGSASGQYQLTASLSTDEGTGTEFDEICTAADNRQCGWLQTGWQIRNSSVSDFLSDGGSPSLQPFLLDPETIVAKGLWLNFYTTSDSTTAPTREWSYMVVLKPKKMDPKETILHLIKNIAQDVVN
jgi:hypothetical protein